MSAQVLDCKVVAQAIKDDCKAAADALKAQGITPKLGIVRVGEKGPDLSYEKGATKTMNEAGIEVVTGQIIAHRTCEVYIQLQAFFLGHSRLQSFDKGLIWFLLLQIHKKIFCFLY